METVILVAVLSKGCKVDLPSIHSLLWLEGVKVAGAAARKPGSAALSAMINNLPLFFMNILHATLALF